MAAETYPLRHPEISPQISPTEELSLHLAKTETLQSSMLLKLADAQSAEGAKLCSPGRAWVDIFKGQSPGTGVPGARFVRWAGKGRHKGS